MAILKKIKSTFLPSAYEAEQRRIKVFGTPSKTVAATVIVGSAAAAIVAPVVIGAAGARGAAVAVGRAAAANPIKAAVIGTAAVPIIAGSVARDPTIVTRTPYEVANFSGDLYKAAKNPSIESFKEVIEESPLLSTATGLLVAGTGAAALVSAGTNLIKNADNEITLPEGAFVSSTPRSTSSPSGSPIPLTPQTQVIGREAGTRSIVKRKAKKITKQPAVNVRVYNQNAYIAPRARY